MACLDELNQSADKTWIGISRATGDMKKFETLGQFQQYQEALGCQPVRPSPYVESNAGKNTTPPGFSSSNHVTLQHKHDLMQHLINGREPKRQKMR